MVLGGCLVKVGLDRMKWGQGQRDVGLGVGVVVGRFERVENMEIRVVSVWFRTWLEPPLEG